MSGFSGFSPAATRFFSDLAANQERAWFEAHKAFYEREVKAPMGALIADLAAELVRRKLPLTSSSARSSRPPCARRDWWATSPTSPRIVSRCWSLAGTRCPE